jgi:ubiquinone/menaquinone biosynthesis C-methylase UbiE
LDLSTGMLAVAAGKRTGARLVCDDATALPFRDGVLDGVVSTFTLELFPEAEIPRFLAECRRVLKPGGRLCVASLSARGPDTWVRRGYAWSHRVFPGVVDCRPIPVEEVVQGAGFADVSAAPVPLVGLQVDVVVGWVSGSLT